jgi:hypothetical protein
MNRFALPIALASLLGLTLAASSTMAAGVALGARLGTPGLGLEATGSVTRGVNVRAGLNFGSIHTTAAVDLSSGEVGADVDFDASLRLRSAMALVDVHPGAGGFRLTGGIVRNSNRITLDATVTATVTVSDHTYSASDVAALLAEGVWGRRWVPYLGLGFGNPVNTSRRVTFLFDLGVFFQGRPHVSLTARGVAAGAPALQDDLDTEAAKINNEDLNKNYFKYYPVLSIGVAFRLF